MRGRFVAAVAAALVLVGAVTASAQPEPDPSKQCKKGRTTGTASGNAADENQNSFVCVNQETGEISDDKGQFAGDESSFDNDLNDNGLVCYDATNEVVTDDHEVDGFPTYPPGFAIVPSAFFP